MRIILDGAVLDGLFQNRKPTSGLLQLQSAPLETRLRLLPTYLFPVLVCVASLILGLHQCLLQLFLRLSHQFVGNGSFPKKKRKPVQ